MIISSAQIEKNYNRGNLDSQKKKKKIVFHKILISLHSERVRFPQCIKYYLQTSCSNTELPNLENEYTYLQHLEYNITSKNYK